MAKISVHLCSRNYNHFPARLLLTTNSPSLLLVITEDAVKSFVSLEILGDLTKSKVGELMSVSNEDSFTLTEDLLTVLNL